MTYREKVRELLNDVFTDIDQIEDEVKELRARLGVLHTLQDIVFENYTLKIKEETND
jgi:regulator of replication initiation timing